MQNTKELVFKNDEVTIHTDIIKSMSTGKPVKRWIIKKTGNDYVLNEVCSTCKFSKKETIDYIISITQKYLIIGNSLIPDDPLNHKIKWEKLLANI